MNGGLDNRLKNRLHVRRGFADHAQNVRAGRLTGQRCLCVPEKLHILNRDHRLITKGLRQFNLLWTERALDLA